MEHLNSNTLEDLTKQVVTAALYSGDMDHDHPEDQESHPYFDDRIHTICLEELEKLFYSLDQEIGFQEAILHQYAPRVDWSKESWDLDEIRLYKFTKDLSTLVQRLYHLRYIVQEQIKNRSTQPESYCPDRDGEDLKNLQNDFGKDLLKLFYRGWPIPEPAEA